MPVHTRWGLHRLGPTTAPLVAFVVVVVTCRPAHAYVDPGTLSIVLQGTVAGIAALALYFRARVTKLFSIFRRRSKCEEPEAPGANSGGKAESDPDDQ
ncbi:MAG: hypothetical protein OXG82_08335 [Gammaproteobacteria bacterium]|nr:hypothetical protein [Gammaproteobacteria bacterium]